MSPCIRRSLCKSNKQLMRSTSQAVYCILINHTSGLPEQADCWSGVQIFAVQYDKTRQPTDYHARCVVLIRIQSERLALGKKDLINLLRSMTLSPSWMMMDSRKESSWLVDKVNLKTKPYDHERLDRTINNLKGHTQGKSTKKRGRPKKWEACGLSG